MVSFTRGRLDQRQHLTVRSVISGNGNSRLIVAYPDGLHQLRYFASDSALFDGTMALQVDLEADGWKPVRALAPRNGLRPLKPTDYGWTTGR